jgi:hypothetical protein
MKQLIIILGLTFLISSFVQIKSDKSSITGEWKLKQIGINQSDPPSSTDFNINSYSSDPIFLNDSVLSINEDNTYSILNSGKKGMYSIVEDTIQTQIWKRKMNNLVIGGISYLIVQLKPNELLLSRKFNNDISYGYYYVK